MVETGREDRIVTCAIPDTHYGVRVTFAADGSVERYVELVDGKPEGEAKRFSSDGDVIENGTFRDGLRSGEWTEWHGDRFTRGTYSRGMRVGRWEVVQQREQSKPDFAVSFDDGKPVGAMRAIESYQVPMAVAEGTTLALALFGLATDRPALTIAGSAGFVAAGPLVHAWQQNDGDRRSAAMQSLKLRPLVLAGTFLLYSMGKLLDGIDCVDYQDSDGEGTDIGCDDWQFDYNTDYNWTALLITSAALIVLGDMDNSTRGTRADVSEAWPQLSIVPTTGGASVSVGGRL